jgi:nucleotide-binding universal stress UspA family protein
VIVGADEQTDQDAVEFAAAAAAASSEPLTLVRAVGLPPYCAPDEYGGHPELVDSMRNEARASLDVRCSALRKLHPSLRVDGRVVIGEPPLVMVREAEHAGLVVVGTHHRSPLTALFVGSVGHDLLVNMPCPVAIVPRSVPEPIDDDEVAVVARVSL